MTENPQDTVPPVADLPAVDVVVVGSGAAGMSAAITAARNGLSTILVEKSEYWGGSSSRSGVECGFQETRYFAARRRRMILTLREHI